MFFPGAKGIPLTIDFVNINGDPITLATSTKLKAKKPSVEAYHKGWKVIGFPPEQLLQARNNHARDIGDCRVAGLPSPGPFDEDAFVRKNAPKKVRPAPYSLKESAEDCAQLARQAGWKYVRVEAVAKGDK